MESKRQQKFSRMIQKELAEIFQRDAKNMFEGAFVTVTAVRVSPDFGQAKVYLGFLLVKDKEKSIEMVKAQSKGIRRILGEKIRKQVRIIPELIFFLDDSVEYANKMDDLLSKLEIPPAEEEDKNEEKE